MAELTEFSFSVIATVCVFAVGFYAFLALFHPGLKYKIASPPDGELTSEEFCCMLEALADAKLNRQTSIEVLTNGENFYPAELDAIRSARLSINLEAYIFQRGRVTREVISALAERARAGVTVNLLLDAVGSFLTTNSYLRDLREAGGQVAWYTPLRWHNWPRYNNRTHRELLIVDGDVAFVGGAGFADHWLHAKGKALRWRDDMFRITGDAVTILQSTFASNWLEASGEIITGDKYFPCNPRGGGSAITLVVNSEPSVGGSTRGRILFQMLLAAAKRSIHITTPYFLPDKSLRQELVKAMETRGVEVRIICPGKHSDHFLTRRSSRSLYGDLLKAGAGVYEYRPAMMHAKVLTVDGVWGVIGTTNFDNRSFGLNDEVNVAIREPEIVQRLEEDFENDLGESDQVSYQEWKNRPVLDRLGEWLGWLIERQQ